ncbi:MAG: energy transducer TonB [Pyrinomonadaceae bacterium]
MKSVICLSFLLVSFSMAAGQEKAVKAEASFYGGGVETISLPLPDYPEDGRSIWVRGPISVPISINATGDVISTRSAEGPYPVCQGVTDPKIVALRQLAESAARAAKFKLAADMQWRSEMTGTITYEFPVLPVPQNDPTPAKVVSGDSPKGLGVDRGVRIDGTNEPKEMRLDRLTTVDEVNNEPNRSRVTKLRSMDDSGKKGDPHDQTSSGKGGLSVGAREAGNGDTVSGGVLNGKATALRKPIYPAAAIAVRAGGAVSVQVLIDEGGQIFTAAAVSGHPLLRKAAEIAACGSSFSPTLLEGNPVKVSGVITYNFVP